MHITHNRRVIIALVAVALLLATLILVFQYINSTKVYSVTLDTDEGTIVVTQKVTSGEVVVRPNDPVKEGYKFLYWELDGKEFDFSDPVSGDLALAAKWEPVTYNVSFHSNGGSMLPDQTIAYGGRVSKPSNPTRDGFTFVGWFLSDEEYDFAEVVESDLELFARWEADETETEGSEPQTDPVVTTKIETETSVIAYKTVRQNDSTLEEGRTTVKQQGQNGEITITYTVTYTDGKETGRTEISRKTIKPPVDEIILVGTQAIVTEPVDTTPPIITLLGNATENVINGADYTDAGATAADDVDGDITAGIVVAGDTVITATAGTYVITYNVRDAAGNAATEVTRTVIVAEPLDTTAPIITLLGNATENVINGTDYTDAGATAADDVDGDITAGIVVAGDTVNTATAGTYVITYNVRDAAGNAATEVTRTVIVAEPIRVIAIYVSTSAILTSTASFPTTVQVIIYPENATNKNVVWSSSNTSAVTVEDGEVTLLDVDFRGIMTIRATTIDGNKAATVFVSSLSAADTRLFWSFNEVFRGDRFDSLDLTNEEDFRAIEYLLNSVHFDRMAAALPNVDGKDAFLERFISFRTEVNAARLTFNTLQIETAQELIAGASYTMTQETATDEAIIKSTIEGIIESEISAINSYYEITTTVNQVDYAPAVAGNAENPAGVNGTYTFTVDVSNSTATGSTATLTMTIIATPFADRP